MQNNNNNNNNNSTPRSSSSFSEKFSQKTSGKIAAIFIATSVAILMVGILTPTWIKLQQPWLEVYKPAAGYSGVYFFSHLVWAVLWAGLYFGLRHKEHVGTVKLWLLVFVMSLAIATGLITGSLPWLPGPWVSPLELVKGDEEKDMLSSTFPLSLL